MQGRRPVLVLAVLAASTLAASGCGGGGRSTASTTVPRGGATTTTAPAPTAPLTGLPDRSGASQHRPALTVKIENLPAARPQTGLDRADVVYEEVVDGGITRFLAVFQSTAPETVGPIRSVRVTDPEVVWPLGGIFAYSGGAPTPVAAIRGAPVHTVDETAAGAAMFRSSDRSAPHNLYGYPAKLWALGGTPAPPPPLFSYLPAGGKVGGTPVSSFTIGYTALYGQPTSTWDAGSRTWKRAYGSQPFTMTDGKQIAPTTVIVQFVTYSPAPGAPGAKAALVGSGDAWVFAQGRVVKGRWQRADLASVTRYVDAAGKAIRIPPGRTWVELVPTGSPVTVETPPAATTSKG